jgi:hypothetical protein
MADDDGTQVDLSAYLTDLPSEQVLLWLPPPIDRRIDDLITALRSHDPGRELGEVKRSELVGAALLRLSPDVALARAIRSYRSAHVYKAIWDETRTTGMATIPARKKGRRPRQPAE